MNRGRGTLLAGFAVVVAAALAAPAPAQATSLSHATLSHREYAAAVRLAREQVRSSNATFTSATVTVGPGHVTQPNTGHPCGSGRVLFLKLIGDFPGVLVTGHPVKPGERADFTVRDMVITADARTGVACLVGAGTGQPRPMADAASLDVGRLQPRAGLLDIAGRIWAV